MYSNTLLCYYNTGPKVLSVVNKDTDCASLKNPSDMFMQVIEMPEHNPGQMGGTMRLGKRRTIFKGTTSILSTLLGMICHEVLNCFNAVFAVFGYYRNDY